ncbi:MAG TPA: helix-turn-helix domain-containing protein [Solirubrobacteraceae bacterium]|nr:helix-turn-helix domain-containing protein [Solirubrobacteraceae bacterium]
MSREPSAEGEPRPEGRTPEARVQGSSRHAVVRPLDDRAARPADDEAARLTGQHRGTGEPLVSITLSRNQVDHVMRVALGEGAAPSMSALVAGSGFHGAHVKQSLGARYRSLQDNRRLSRSLLAGLLVLSCFPPEGVDLGIKDISEQLDLNTSTVHRYVVTLVAAGLLERDPETRRYRLLPE